MNASAIYYPTEVPSYLFRYICKDDDSTQRNMLDVLYPAVFCRHQARQIWRYDEFYTVLYHNAFYVYIVKVINDR